jgi:hypothetical protein
MFHMTNDSDKFRTAEELERLGAYRVTGQRWEKGDQRWLPLYEGKMVSIYNHRYAAVRSNPNNISEQGVAVHSTLHPYPAGAGCATAAGGRRTRSAPPGMVPVLS